MNYREYIKAIMFDYDGTLINYDYVVSDYTKKALSELQDKDYVLCISSGRPCYIALKAFREDFGDYRLDYIFGCNGSEIMDVKSNKIDILYPIKAEDVVKLSYTLDHPKLVLGIYEGDRFLMNRETDSSIILDWLERRELKPVIYDFSKNDLDRSKVLGLFDPNDFDIIDPFLRNADLGECNSAYSAKFCYEITAKGISKGKTVQELCKIINCDNKQILSFGDMANDLDMLKASTGVAMANSSVEVLNEISLRTGDVSKEGIYQFLSENGLI